MKNILSLLLIVNTLTLRGQYSISYGVTPSVGYTDATNRSNQSDSTYAKSIDPLKKNNYWTKDFYDGWRIFPQNAEQNQNLIRAVSKKIEEEKVDLVIKKLEEERSAELNKLGVASSNATDEDKIINKKYDELIAVQIRLKKELHRLGVKYYFLFRDDRTFQKFPTGIYDTDIRAEYFYENVVNAKSNKFLGSYLISYGKSGKLSAFSELYADYFGPFRLGLGTLISNNTIVGKDSAGVTLIDSSERKDDAIQRILGGGGNLVVNLDYPLFYVKSKGERFRILSSANIRGAIDVPSIGTYSSDFIAKFDPAISTTVFLSGYNGEIVIFGAHRFSRLMGNSALYEYLKIKDEGIWVNQASLGLIISSQFRFGVNFNFGDPYIINNFPTTVFVAIVPK